MQLTFDKMEGAGNDFILIDNRQGYIPNQIKRKLAVEYCNRRLGIGADGLILVQNDPEFDFSWDFYNADGSSAEMCGNGARCVARFANKIGAAGESMIFRSLAGPIKAQITSRGAKVQLTDAILPAASEMIEVEGDKLEIWRINTGVPHAVIKVLDLEKVDVKRVGAAIRRHTHFAPAGTNANFIDLLADNALVIRTYERGVEDETLACGTGSVAASIVASQFFGKHSPVQVVTKSGEELIIHFRLEGGRATGVFLEGGARLVFSGSFTL